MSNTLFGMSLFLLTIYVACVWCEETEVAIENSENNLIETGRRRTGFGLHKWWGIYGLHALGVLYWLKVKAVVVAFIVGTAIVWGFKYFKGHGCSSEIIHESPLISYDHGPAWSSGPHDHIPYSLDHNPFEHDHGHDHHEHDHFSSSDIVSDSYPGEYAGAYSDVQPSGPSSIGVDHSRHSRQLLDSEKQVSDIVFAFLGITNDGCRRRFICEMEFRSKSNPFTRIAFGIVGRGLFSKYVNRANVNGRAASFRQCADVNPDCVMIEENIDDNNENEVANDDYEYRSLKENNDDFEKENESNLKAEKDLALHKSSTAASSDPIARVIFKRSQSAN